MKIEKWNQGWQWWEEKNSFSLIWKTPSQAREITLPHDAMMARQARADSPNGGSTGFRNGSNDTYIKTLTLQPADLGKQHLLRFEGVYAHAAVFVNEQPVASQAYGYSAFYADLTPFLHAGDNEIRVLSRNSNMPNSRWYTGSGIYRDVYLLTAGPVHLEADGIQVQTEEADKDYAVLLVTAHAKNVSSLSRSLCLHMDILREGSPETTAQESVSFFLAAGHTTAVTRRILVPRPELWSAETPALYQCRCRLCADDGSLLDESVDSFGIRTLSLDAARGLRVNGQPVKLRGACIHHDSGLLGAATYEDAHLRQIRMLQQAGFNAVRMAHHPAAAALLRACDKIGMYVMEEFTDMWTRPKRDLDYSLDFSSCWQADIDRMVRHDFNHPSVIFYSVGNEIPEIGTDAGSDLCARIAGRIKALDSTRYTTAGINGLFIAGDRLDQIMADLARQHPDGDVNDVMGDQNTQMDRLVTHDIVTERLEKACHALDVAGYNYMTARYELDAARYPNRVMVGSETFPPEIARNWRVISKLPGVIGDFTWTGWDYIGEAGIGIPAYHRGEGGNHAEFPCQLAYCGDFDITGYRRPLSYYREIVFGLRRRPYLAVQPPLHYGETLLKSRWIMSDAESRWDYPGFEGKPVQVEVYAPGQEVALYLDGTLLGRQPLTDCRAVFDTVYRPGTLTAVCPDDPEKNSFSLQTPTDAQQLSLYCDFAGQELIYVNVILTDKEGVPVQNWEEPLYIQVTGGVLLGAGNGNPKPLPPENGADACTWRGRAQIILRRTATEVQLCVTSNSGLEACCTVH